MQSIQLEQAFGEEDTDLSVVSLLEYWEYFIH